ncbi:MAG: MFS transporter [Anaerolineae bacterium]|nr:MFS transporter [Anaerolineae bacterium]
MDRRLPTILLIVFVQLVGASMALPVLPLFAQRQFALQPQVITLLVSVFFLAQFLAGPTIGRLSDQYGRLPVLLVSQAGTVLSFLMISTAESALVLFAARVLDGITGGNLVVAQAYITDITPREQRTQALGYIFASFGLGFTVGRPWVACWQQPLASVRLLQLRQWPLLSPCC